MHPAALAAVTATGFARLHVLQAWHGAGADRRLVGLWALGQSRVARLWPSILTFHGVVFRHRVLGHDVMAPADAVDKITERAVYLKSSSNDAEKFERFHEMHVQRLGLTGLFRWKHLGWKDSSE